VAGEYDRRRYDDIAWERGDIQFDEDGNLVVPAWQLGQQAMFVGCFTNVLFAEMFADVADTAGDEVKPADPLEPAARGPGRTARGAPPPPSTLTLFCQIVPWRRHQSRPFGPLPMSDSPLLAHFLWPSDLGALTVAYCSPASTAIVLGTDRGDGVRFACLSRSAQRRDN